MTNDNKHLDSLGDTEFDPGKPATNPVEENHHAIPGLCDCADCKKARANIERPYLDDVNKLSAYMSPPEFNFVKREVSHDLWANRAAKMHCSTCMWFVAKHGNSKSLSPSIGRCRRHAPTMGGYPVTYTNDWCGDHKLDENKLHE